MFEAKLTIMNETGLHARPASDLVALSSKFKSEIYILSETGIINAKSIINVLGGGIYKGTEITLQVTGEDEEEAGRALVELLENLTD